MKFNPFRPGEIVSPGMFAGRLKELHQIGRAFYQTAQKNPRHFIITGERGIGKSSLMLYSSYVSIGELETLENFKPNFAVLSAFVVEQDDLQRVIIKLVNDFQKRFKENEGIITLFRKVWESIGEISVAGIGIKKKNGSLLETMQDNFCYFIEEAWKQLKDKYDGILILIDEVDKIKNTTGLASFIKVTLEKLKFDGISQLMFGLAGLPDVIDKLRDDHPSVLRIFDYHYLEPLEYKYREEVIIKGLTEAKNTTGIETKIEPLALRRICSLSEGYPHFLQEFGYSSFEVDNDNNITDDDAKAGALGTSLFEGSIKRLGKQCFEKMYYDAVKSDEYRKVLNIMAKQWTSWVNKDVIRKEFKGSESTLTNALKALADRAIILKDSSRKGYYRLQWRAFAAYINIYTKIEAEKSPKATA